MTEYGTIVDKPESDPKHQLLSVSQSYFQSAKLDVKTRVKKLYDPTNWFHTLGSILSQSYFSTAFFTIACVCTLVVAVAASPSLRVSPSDRTCRAWCSHISLGPQPHQYTGVVLFLLMSFRLNQSVSSYLSGIRAFYAYKTALRTFVNLLLNRVPRTAISAAVRVRAVAYAIAFPYSVVLDLREQHVFPHGAVDGVLSTEDIAALQAAPTVPLAVLETLTRLISEKIEPNVEKPVANSLHAALGSLVPAYEECERIKQNPQILSYVAHLRILLVTYLVTLPLALVEVLGWTTVPLTWVLTYILMSLEMLAVDIEMPFDGEGKSDLRLSEQCYLFKESALESWQRWTQPSGKNEDDVQFYADVEKPFTFVTKVNGI